MKKVVTLFFLIAMIVNVAFAVGGDELLAKLRQDLSAVETSIEEVEDLRVRREMAYREYEHDVVYSDEDLRVLYEDIKNLEKDLGVKRKVLADKIGSTPEMVELLKKRRAVYSEMERLRTEKQAILNEIRLAETAVHEAEN